MCGDGSRVAAWQRVGLVGWSVGKHHACDSFAVSCANRCADVLSPSINDGKEGGNDNGTISENDASCAAADQHTTGHGYRRSDSEPEAMRIGVAAVWRQRLEGGCLLHRGLGLCGLVCMVFAVQEDAAGPIPSPTDASTASTASIPSAAAFELGVFWGVEAVWGAGLAGCDLL